MIMKQKLSICDSVKLYTKFLILNTIINNMGCNMKEKPEIVKILKQEELNGQLGTTVLEEKQYKYFPSPESKNDEKNNVNEIDKYKNFNSQTDAKNTLKTLINLISDPVVVVDKKGKFLEISERVEDLTGVSRDQLLGSNFMSVDFLTAKSKAILIKNFTKRMLGKNIDKYEIEATSKNGENIILEVNGIKIDYDGKPADLVMFHDISHQKKTEKELKDSKEQWFHLLENIPDVIMTIDQDGKILTINHPIKGLKKEEVIGKNLKEYESEKHCHIRKDALKNVFETGKPQTYEIVGVDKDGQYNAWYETRIIPVDYQDQNQKVIMISRDITERKKTEKNLKEKIEELEKFQKVTVDRELSMIKLKKEINKLCEKCGKKPKYKIEA